MSVFWRCPKEEFDIFVVNFCCNFAFKQVVGNFCNDLAIKKAQEAGIGWVVCGGKNHLKSFKLCKSLKWKVEANKGYCLHNAQF